MQKLKWNYVIFVAKTWIRKFISNPKTFIYLFMNLQSIDFNPASHLKTKNNSNFAVNLAEMPKEATIHFYR